MGSGLEIERKFLIEVPDLEKTDIIQVFNIKQTYLADGENGSQRRVRKIESENNVYMTYTEKIFLSPVIREEREYNINSTQYDKLLKEAKDTVVEKKRVVFSYKNQNFEMDLYPFSDKYAILELELQSPEQQIDFPEYISVLKEVSDNRAYSNASLAKIGAFPEV